MLTAISETPFEYRERADAVAASAPRRPGSDEFFGDGSSTRCCRARSASFELFKGSTAFKPRDWAFRVTPQFNLNYVNTARTQRPQHLARGSGRRGAASDIALQEAFGEVKLFDVGPNYDFVSVRAGIQPFNSDFRGFLFRDTNLGVRAFGNWGRNRNQWNVAYFDQLEKETNSELNLTRAPQPAGVDRELLPAGFPDPGLHHLAELSRQLRRGEEFFFDENGFLVRPSPIGLDPAARGEGLLRRRRRRRPLGRLNITHQYYQAFGDDDFNGIAGQPVDIKAHFAAVEVSIDKDWWRPRASVRLRVG